MVNGERCHWWVKVLKAASRNSIIPPLLPLFPLWLQQNKMLGAFGVRILCEQLEFDRTEAILIGLWEERPYNASYGREEETRKT